jgi:hypothetical protein
LNVNWHPTIIPDREAVVSVVAEEVDQNVEDMVVALDKVDVEEEAAVVQVVDGSRTVMEVAVVVVLDMVQAMKVGEVSIID